METILIIGGILCVVIVTLAIIEKKKSKDSNVISNIPDPQEIDVLPNEETPVTPTETIPAEMPEKPLPVNCQLAQFQPAPQDYFYIDCCGNPKKGEGFEPWEKRAPVAIDANKEFFGMTLLDVEAEINC